MASDGDEIFLFDRRNSSSPSKTILLSKFNSFAKLKEEIHELINAENDDFIICTTERDEINEESFSKIKGGETFYVLNSIEQELPASTALEINFMPHYDTIVKSGMYEYYASEGQNPLSYAFAELIDNSLGATANNVDTRHIELRLMLEEQNYDKSSLYIMDNGCGMSAQELNNWAIYRMSKFVRARLCNQEKNINEFSHVKKSLNSNISYFGVGGKQAIFYIGNSVRMITKCSNSKDVHELCISKDQFEKKERANQSVYTSFIRNRKPGDVSHLDGDDDNHLVDLIRKNEIGKDSFTFVVITGILHEHVKSAKQNYRLWCQQLAHIYHYYVHGPEGNSVNSNVEDEEFQEDGNINIELNLYLKGNLFRATNLRHVTNDPPTQFKLSAASQMEFKAVVDGTGIVEGLLRYHPFLYDHETYPVENSVIEGDDDCDNEEQNSQPARGKRPIFECYWNGRLIPYTCIDEFDWCAIPKKSRVIPLECYNRLSGVLWANEKFQVSTNKLTFMDLELKLRDKNTVFTRIIDGQERRGNIDKHFMEWLRECHEIHDKQIMFSSCKGTVTRSELHRGRQYPWTEFHSVDWDGKTFKKNQLVKMMRSQGISSNLYGTINRFFLYGDHEGVTYSTGGEVEITQQPRLLYDNVIKVFPLHKIDLQVSKQSIRALISDEEEKLPEKIILSWPEGDEVKNNDKIPAGKTIGAMKVEIANRKGDLINKVPGSAAKKLLVELQVTWHSQNGDVLIAQYISQHAKNWPYWFRKMENLKNLGSYSITLQVFLNDSTTYKLGGNQLPFKKIYFSITEAEPDKFTFGVLNGPFKIGLPFQINLEFQDKYGNPTKPNENMKPLLKASGLNLSGGTMVFKNNVLCLKDIIAQGSVESSTGKNFSLDVYIPTLNEKNSSQILKIRLLPGLPISMELLSENFEIENGTAPSFNLSFTDVSGNAAIDDRTSVVCKFSTTDPEYKNMNFPTYTSQTSKGGIMSISGLPIKLPRMKSPLMMKADFSILNVPNAKGLCKEICVVPSSDVASLSLSYLEDGIRVEIHKGKEIVLAAGTSLSGLELKLYDESGKEVEITTSISSKILLNWASMQQKSELNLTEGKLPSISVPITSKSTQYCHITLASQKSFVEFDFNIKAKSGSIASMKAKLTYGNTARLGERLPSDIVVSLRDQYGNFCQKPKKEAMNDLKDLTIISDILNYSKLEKALEQNSGFVFTSIHIKDDIQIGMHEFCIKWRDLTDYVRINISAGHPMCLRYLNFPNDEPITVCNENFLDNELVVQLCDSMGNPTIGPNFKVQLHCDNDFNFNPSIQSVHSNNEGQANFGLLSPVVKSKYFVDCPLGTCNSLMKKCYGFFTVYAKAVHNRNSITGSNLIFHVHSDPNRPFQIKVDYDSSKIYSVGDQLEELKISVIAEDGSLFKLIQPSQVHMKFWSSKKSSQVIICEPSSRKTDDAFGTFYFRDKLTLEQAGRCNIQFQTSGQFSLLSEIVIINVQCGIPHRIMPSKQLASPVVSNTSVDFKRTLMDSVTFLLQDSFDNKVDLNLNGTLSLKVICPPDSQVPSSKIPALDNQFLKVPIKRSMGFVETVKIKKNAVGINGQQYILRCKCHIPDLKDDILPYDLPFLFYNDVDKQKQMMNLSLERDQLKCLIEGYKDVFKTLHELKSTLQNTRSNISKEIHALKISLNISGNIDSIEDKIRVAKVEKEKLETKNRRICELIPAPEEEGILGKVGFLGFVDDPIAAHVLSWHLAADMDCIITYTMEKALEVYHKYGTQYQVLAINTIFKKNLPDWKKPLPHTKIRTFRPTGAPIYARNLLNFPKETENCKIVFGMLLGDTIMLDTIDDATKYREEVVKHSYCPTLLTRSGDRIRSNGKFGGFQNKAPPMDRLKGAIFGESVPKKLEDKTNYIEKLMLLKSTMLKFEQVDKNLKIHLAKENNKESHQQKKEWMEAEDKLKDVEERLGIKSNEITEISSQQNNNRSRSSPIKSSAKSPSPRQTKSRLGRRSASKRFSSPATKRRVK